ncbi:MAG: polysaccharide biosynthesis C-terminal domain-containing protein, partial [Clostridia bacterium]
LSLGRLSSVCLYFSAGFIGKRWIGEINCVPALKILSASLPFISVSAVFGGYFTGVERVIRSVSVNIAEQISRICVTVILLNTFGGGGIREICASLGAAAVFGEIVNCTAHSILYIIDIRRFPKNSRSDRYFSKIFGTAMPIAVSAYMRTGLSSLGHILIPKGLQASGSDFEKSFATYGTIHGMAFPVLLFPSALLTALSELIIPRLTAAQSEKNQKGIDYMTTRVIKIGLIFSVCVAGIMFFFGDILGQKIYKNTDVSHYLCCFAPLIPIMYCDTITDGCLKGLGQHMKAMFINIAEATLNVILLYILIPRYAITGYAVSIYVCECFNFVLSFGRLLYVADIDIGLSDIVRIIFSIAAAAKLTAFILPTGNIIILILVTVLLYTAILYAVRVILKSDIMWFRSILARR